jgi:hypothetical protein
MNFSDYTNEQLKKENIINMIEEDIERLIRQKKITLETPIENVFLEYCRDLKCELLDSGYNKNDIKHQVFIKQTIQGELNRLKKV